MIKLEIKDPDSVRKWNTDKPGDRNDQHDFKKMKAFDDFNQDDSGILNQTHIFMDHSMLVIMLKGENSPSKNSQPPVENWFPL